MSIRNEAWSCWFGQDFSRLFVELQEEKDDFCLYKIDKGEENKIKEKKRKQNVTGQLWVGKGGL